MLGRASSAPSADRHTAIETRRAPVPGDLEAEPMSNPISRLVGTIKRRLPIDNGFGRNVLRLFAANAAAQVLTFAAYPILTRLYTPEQLGILSVVLFAMMILTPASTLRYEIALPLCRTDAEAGSVLTLCFATVLATTTLFAIALLAAPAPLVDAIGPAAPYRLFLPLALLAFGAYNVLTYEATRVARYADIAKTRVSQALVGPVIQIALGVVSGGTIGLLTGFTIGLSAGTVNLSRRLIFKSSSILSGVTLRGVIDAAQKYRRFPLFSSWAGILLAGSASLGNIAFTSLYGAAIGGFLFLGDRVMMQPLRVSGNAFLQVFMGDAPRALDRSPAEFKRLFLGVLWKQAAVSGIWLGGVYACATFALPIIFGHSWGPASQYIDAMLIGYLPSAAAIPVSHTLLLMGRQRLSAFLDACRFGALLASIVIARHFDATPIESVFIYSATQGIAQCLILGLIYRRVSHLPAPSQPD
jgi:O-antigen/teichoic acid export membrane protein